MPYKCRKGDNNVVDVDNNRFFNGMYNNRGDELICHKEYITNKKYQLFTGKYVFGVKPAKITQVQAVSQNFKNFNPINVVEVQNQQQ